MGKPCTEKKRYLTEKSAQIVADWQSQRHPRWSFRVYRCVICSYFHTTKQEAVSRTRFWKGVI
jgi:hypothetical protein